MRNIKRIPTLIVLICVALTACRPNPAPTDEPTVAQAPIEEPGQPEVTLIFWFFSPFHAKLQSGGRYGLLCGFS